MLAALIGAPGNDASESEKAASGVVKFLDKWLRMGVRRSSSSSRGKAREVSSSPFSNRAANSVMTMLVCSRIGTYALPFRKNTALCSTSSGTRVQSTLNQFSSSNLLIPGVDASSRSPNCCFSSSATTSQFKFKVSTKARRSFPSSSWKRSLNSIVSTLAKRRRRSSVPENARRSIKCE